MKRKRFHLRPATRMRVWLGTGLLQLAMLTTTVVAEDSVDAATDGERLFALHVKPLLAEKCLACHGADPDNIEGGFDIRSRASVMKGGDYFEDQVMIPGQGEESSLYLTTTREEPGFEMPPKEADQLSQQQQWWIRDWINAGAPWPDEKRVKAIQEAYAEGELVKTSRALSEDWQNRRYDPDKLWAYRPVKVATVPNDQHPIDFFIDARLDDAKLSPAPGADPKKLARRMSFGFTGLPPAMKEVRKFCDSYESDPSAAVTQYAEQLMASPHYGEQFGQHWLDVVRYADTAGFANDFCRPNAWRFRDYVVRSFNQDRPYNDFVREQIAGDEIDPGDPEKLVATGFLRMGAWEHTGMSVFKETRQQWLDDVTDSVGQTFLAHAMQCAKCHDHKFDPIPTRDYYGMMAVFSTTQFAERNAPFLEEENLAGFERSDQWVRAKVDEYRKQKKSLEQKVAAARKSEKGDAKVGDNGLDPGDEASLARMSKNISRHTWELDRTKPIALSVYTGATAQLKGVKGRLVVPKNRWSSGKIEKDAILAGGSVYSPSDPVTPSALSAAVSLGDMKPQEFPGGKAARRTALADWIVDPANPLTARVMVNRVWSWHFGKSIAGNPNNFGGTGALPTHPELLDFLAHWFIENGWSVKKLNALIVSSQAYRRSSLHPSPDALSEKDPGGSLYATFQTRRLTAEEIRDAMLVASGEMNREVGGIPACPDINMEVALQPRQLMGGAASVYEPDALPIHRNRRSLYAAKHRGLRDPFMESFNQPGPDRSCELRETSTVAPQALTLMNGQEIHDRSIAMAARLMKTHQADDELVSAAYRLALSRNPTQRELEACLEHFHEATHEEENKTYAPATFPDRISRTVMAEKTGEPYTFEEYMPAYTNYQPDLLASEVNAKTRGLAHICLVLFNLNEFGYLD